MIPKGTEKRHTVQLHAIQIPLSQRASGGDLSLIQVSGRWPVRTE